MANQIPLSGATSAAGGVFLPDEQGRLLATGVLNMTGAASLAGDSIVTSRRKTKFPIVLGDPTAELVGEGGVKPVTGMEFGETFLNIRKVATIVPFTDELLEDADKDMAVEVETRVRRAIARKIDELVVGKQSGVNITPVNGFDTMLRSTTSTVEVVTTNQDWLKRGVSQAMGVLEDNGYDDESQMAILLPAGTKRHIRDARSAVDATKDLYDNPEDPFYGVKREYSHNLNRLSDAVGATVIKGFVVYQPNLHFRIRTQVKVKVSTEATINDGVQNRNSFQEDLTLMRFETRQGFMVHDLNRAVVALVDAA